MLTPEQKAKYLAKFEAEKAHRLAIIGRIGDAEKSGNREAMIEALEEMKAHLHSLSQRDCLDCEEIFREVYDLPPSSQDDEEENPFS